MASPVNGNDGGWTPPSTGYLRGEALVEVANGLDRTASGQFAFNMREDHLHPSPHVVPRPGRAPR